MAAAIERLRQAVLQATNQQQTTLAYVELFRAATGSELDKLEDDPVASIALEAAWARRRLYQPQPNHLLEAVFVRRFLAILTRRLGMPPKWWEELLFKGVVYTDDRMFFPAPAGSRHITRAGLWAPVHVDADPDPAGGATLTSRGQTVRIPSETWKQALSKAERSGGASMLTSMVQGKSCFFAIYASASCEYYVWRLDSNARPMKWRAESWAAGCPQLGGQTNHELELAADHRTLLTFGAAPHALYAEAFDRQSGTPVVRFSTSLWRL